MNRSMIMRVLVICAGLCAPLAITTQAQATPVSPVISQVALLPMAVAEGGGGTSEECTDQIKSDDSGGKGILSEIIDYIKEVTEDAAQKLFTGIQTNQKYQYAVHAAFALMITIFGVAFTFGIVPFTMIQGLVRLMKFAIIYTLITEGWGFFQEYAVRFFNDGTDELIAVMVGIALGGGKGDPSQPFAYFDQVVGKVIDPKMMINIIGSAFTGPYGLSMSSIMGFAAMVFIQCMVKALRTYCLSLLAKALMFGIAPIMMCFMLFDRTRQMFSGWVNMMVFWSLCPLMMFGFLAFYVVLMETAADNILKTQWCWVDFKQVGNAGQSMQFWRPKDKGQPDKDSWTWKGKEGGSGNDDFPINVIDALTFLLLAFLCSKFIDAIDSIAGEIASVQLNLDQAGGLDKMFKGGNKQGGNAGGRQRQQPANTRGRGPSTTT